MANQRASSSSASFPKSREDQVFLSFRGEDTRHNFTDHLYSALCQRRINTFRDDDDLGRGEEISRALLTAIEESKISVIVFSKNYASSRWCLDELVKILDCKESNQQRVIPVFYKVNPSDVRNQRGSFGDALANMERKYKDEMDKVNKWRAALSRVADLSGFTLDEYQSESKFIQNIIEEILKHVSNLVCFEVAKHPVGMQAQVQVMNKLLDLEENDVRMVGVWGTGGIGKTTITKAVYNLIAREFEGCCFLEDVRECSMSHGGLAKLQETLLSEILRVEKLEVTNVDKGVTMIKEWLRRRKVLLVLDDVDDMEQLHKLVGACDWFGVGSRIIITTRDKQLLTAHDVNLIHEVKILDDPEALELFCCHAFKRSEPPLGDYVKLARRAIRYAQGLPLALKVLGSCLYGGSIGKWEAALHGFKSPKIQDVLKISYNALDHSVQQVFLDIACFFKGKSKMHVTEILVACDPKAGYSIEVLVEKALISVEGYYIWMHDLLEQMGKDIVQQESPDELGGRSRLWSHEDIEHVLTNDTGTKKITGIMLNSPKEDYEIFLNVDCFSKMKNLKIFMNYNVFLSGDIGYLPNMLRVLDWYSCPLQSFPPKFHPKGLRLLNLPYSPIKQRGEGLKHFTKLTFLNLTGSEFLTEISDLSGSPNLRYLYANHCKSLVQVHPSVGSLDKLQVLNFYGCCELTKFPNEVWCKSLEQLDLRNCIKLERFPEIMDKVESLNKLDLFRTAIKELPASIGNLIGLTHLGLSGYPELIVSNGNNVGLTELGIFGCPIKELPAVIQNLIALSGCPIKELLASIGNFTGLTDLDLPGCPIKELPASFGNLIGPIYLDLRGCPIKELPASIGNLIGLTDLDLFGCPIKELPASIGNLIVLTYLGSSECSIGNLIGLTHLGSSECPIKELPASIGNLLGLIHLGSSGCPIKESPASIGNLIGLTHFGLSRCPIKELPASIGNLIGLTDLDLSGCLIKELPASIGNLIGLTHLDLRGCPIKELPASIGNLIGLTHLRLSGCPIKELPASIGNLIGLTDLRLSGCPIKELPASIGNLIGVTHLDLSGCPIKELPASHFMNSHFAHPHPNSPSKAHLFSEERSKH
ncbi:PREDICTED: disease resistance protein TAO1-like [Prunus mume]|uniref:Disease resistance protein TAO1-like n=1 Tax=Prunus mume TaxID=102107 RepID=A0ABM1LLP0_PRUMU|nr:PREDICTED: disease resistance protein TAO1-like [Prunus mume]